MEAFPLHWPDGWPRTNHGQRLSGSIFKNYSFARARDELMDEVRRLGGTDAVLSTNIAVRLDGLPYADRRNPDDPGVSIYFRRKGEPIAMARDAYQRVEANMRSLTLAIDHLRGLERHGGATMTERAFTGFLALPAPGRSCWEVLGCGPLKGSDREGYAAVIEAAFRQQLKRCHPDRGGTDAQMAELNAARQAALREI